jgi:hypothetical protein
VRKVEGNARVIELPIKADYAPNFFFTVALFRENTLLTAQHAIIVPPTERFLNVEITPDKESYEPREKGNLEITVNMKNEDLPDGENQSEPAESSPESGMVIDGLSGNDQAKSSGILIDFFARLPEKTLIDEARLACEFHLTPRTIRRMVENSLLPRPVKIGGRSMWQVGRVVAYLDGIFDQAELEIKRRRNINKLHI